MESNKNNKNKASIEFNPVEFDGQTKSLLIDTVSMCHKIGAMFAPVFKNYSGSKIIINNGMSLNVINQSFAQGEPYVNIYFTPATDNGADMEPNLVGFDQDGGSSKLDRLQNIIGGNSGKAFTLSPLTKECLEEFIPAIGRNYHWDQRVVEDVKQVGVFNSQQEITVSVCGLSLPLILQKIYGGNNVELDDGRKVSYQYLVSPVRQLVGKPDEYVIQVSQLDTKIINDMAKIIGLPSSDRMSYNVYTQ